MEWHKIKRKSRKILAPLASLLQDVNADIISVLGMIIVLVACYFIVEGFFRIAAVVLIFGSIFDTLDGEIARRQNETTDFGAFLDSTLDRYADFFIFSAIAIAGKGEFLTLLSIIALMGAFITSYTRSRAESLGVELKEGFLGRVERILIIIAGLLAGKDYMLYFAIVLAIGTNLTAIQRIIIAYKRLKDGGN